jgi:hypothetical protein
VVDAGGFADSGRGRAPGRQPFAGAGVVAHVCVQPLAKAPLKARAGVAHTEAAARKLLKEQFPQVTDVTSEQVTTAIADSLLADGKFPLTLVVLDEVQQFVGNDVNKAMQVREVPRATGSWLASSLLGCCRRLAAHYTPKPSCTSSLMRVARALANK